MMLFAFDLLNFLPDTALANAATLLARPPNALEVLPAVDDVAVRLASMFARDFSMFADMPSNTCICLSEFNLERVLFLFI